MNDASIHIALDKEVFDQLKLLRKNFDQLRGKVDQIEETSKKSFNSIKSQLKQISFVQITQGLENVKNAFQSINRPGLDYNSTLAEVSAITGVTGKKLDELGKKARQSAVEFGGSASESLNTYKIILSKLGPQIGENSEALDMMERNVRTLSKTMGGDTTKAVEALTTALLQYGVDLSDPISAQKEMERMMNVMAAGAQQGAAEVDQVSQSVIVAGVAMKQAKVSFEEGNAAIQVLAKGGKQGAEAGTALRNVLMKIAGEDILPKKAVEKLESLGVDMKIVSNTSLSLSTRLKELKKAQTDATAIAQVFGLENANSANILLDGIDAMDGFTSAVTGTNTAHEQANIIMESRSEKIKRMNAAIEDQKIAFFELTDGAFAYLEPLSQIAVTFSAFLPMISGARKAFDLLKKSQIAQTLVQKTLNVVSIAFNAILNANPIFLIVAGIAAATAAVYGLINAFKKSNAVEKVNAKLKERVAAKTLDQRVEIEILFQKLKNTKKGTDEYNKSLKDLDALLPGIVDKYNLQEGALNDINAAHREAIRLIEEKAKTEAANEMLRDTFKSIIETKQLITETEAQIKGFSNSGTINKTINGLQGLVYSLQLDALKSKVVDLENEKNAVLNILKPEGAKDLPTNQTALTLAAQTALTLAAQNNLNNAKSRTGKNTNTHGISVAGSDNSPLVKSTKDTKSYTGPEKSFKNINVRIDKLGCDLSFNTTNMKENAAELKRIVTEALVGSIRDVETSI